MLLREEGGKEGERTPAVLSSTSFPPLPPPAYDDIRSRASASLHADSPSSFSELPACRYLFKTPIVSSSLLSPLLRSRSPSLPSETRAYFLCLRCCSQIASGIFYASNGEIHIDYIDCLFNCVSAMWSVLSAELRFPLFLLALSLGRADHPFFSLSPPP